MNATTPPLAFTVAAPLNASSASWPTGADVTVTVTLPEAARLPPASSNWMRGWAPRSAPDFAFPGSVTIDMVAGAPAITVIDCDRTGSPAITASLPSYAVYVTV